MLSALLNTVGFLSSSRFIALFPALQKAIGWSGVHKGLSYVNLVAATAMCSIMFADQRKFARGYIIRSSLLNETVVTLHACSRPSCASRPMWRPGSLRRWSRRVRGVGPFRRPLYAPNRRCAKCGKSSVVECKVGESFMELALCTPYAECAEWIRETKPLRKGEAGWDFSDPTRYPLAPSPTYGDRKAFLKSLWAAPSVKQPLGPIDATDAVDEAADAADAAAAAVVAVGGGLAEAAEAAPPVVVEAEAAEAEVEAEGAGEAAESVQTLLQTVWAESEPGGAGGDDEGGDDAEAADDVVDADASKVTPGEALGRALGIGGESRGEARASRGEDADEPIYEPELPDRPDEGEAE